MFLDTVELIIPIPEENIKDWNRFQISKAGTYLSSQSSIDYVKRTPNIRLQLNPRLADKKRGIHLPQINLVKRDFHWFIQPDGSMTRFYKGTNALECDGSDFEPVMGKYYDFLQDCGLAVKEEDIPNATVRKADISKILLVPPGVPLYPIFEVLRKLDFGSRTETHDKEYRDFRQGGKGLCLTFGTKKAKLASFYDKDTQLRHLLDKTVAEEELIAFQDQHQGNIYQILKLEECLYNKNRVDYVCNKATGQKLKYYTFADFWNKDMLRTILLERGMRLFSGADLKTLLFGNLTPNEIERQLKLAHPSMQASTVAKVGFRMIQASQQGFKQMSQQLSKVHSKSTKDRILRYLRENVSDIPSLPLQDVYDDLFRQLNEMKPVKSTEDLLIPQVEVVPDPKLVLPQQIDIKEPSQLRLMPEPEVVQPLSAYHYH